MSNGSSVTSAPPLGARCPICAGTPRPIGMVGPHPLLRCPGCRLEVLDPQPTDAALATIYGKAYYDAWETGTTAAAVRALKMETFRHRWRAVAGRLPPAPAVLDVGCATGYFMEVVREAGGRPFGVELSAWAAERCRAAFGREAVFRGELDEATFDAMPPDGFDAIFMSDLVEHVRRPARTLLAARRLLRRSGLLVITTPDTGAFSHRVLLQRWPHYKPEHLYYFNAQNLSVLLEQTGFAVVRREVVQKTLSLRYVINHARRFGRWARLARGLGTVLPTAVLDRRFRTRTGELMVVARPGLEL